MASIDELLDAFIRDCKKPTDLIGENGLLKQLCNKPKERVIPAEISKYIGSSEERR
jgi:putative transposase